MTNSSNIFHYRNANNCTNHSNFKKVVKIRQRLRVESKKVIDCLISNKIKGPCNKGLNEQYAVAGNYFNAFN